MEISCSLKRVRVATSVIFSSIVILCLSVVLAVLQTAPVFALPTLEGCGMFPVNNIWNTPVDKLPLDANSAAYVTTIGASRGVHPDFGSGTWEGRPIGIPYNVVSGTQAKVSVSFEYADESDPGPYPIPPGALIEGGDQSTGDRHILVVDKDNCMLYELYAAYPQTDGSWTAGSGAIFDLRSNALRPQTWTSADAAGLPILPGLVRYDEVAAGEIRHAIRFTVPQTRNTYLWPARHKASSLTGTNYPPMGQRFRLKASFDTSGFSHNTRVILDALKKYGMIIADNGSSWYLSGVPDPRWNNDTLVSEFSKVHGSDFEAVDESALMVNINSGQTKGATIKDDFNSDGNSDILWYNTDTGEVALWLLKNGAISDTVPLAAVDTRWQIKGKGDFNGDGNSDILWQNTQTNQVAVWLLDKGTIKSATAMGIADTPWQFKDIGDYNGDGTSDVLWQNSTTGTVAIWLINNAVVVSPAIPATVGAPWVIK
ncbi:VCBS repeat-containing protein [Candidatus Magnetobacterium casensis]|uniref:VCBS repeat-containing protein n=1 Tax=Candidatus Magnetobacterium casense TaxID=1455061 RepID=A0ABS6RV00_9BACT|nr:VCBS repeat-containing protein [Candidatus Magnetobacterium casensis]